ncbi:MAG: hypothetical protein GWP03_03140 [Proteobacteria bacterium]|nr:hypothetical protein [Pseudomonadota bacterium]
MIVLDILFILIIIAGLIYLYRKHRLRRKLRDISVKESKISVKKGLNENLFLEIINSMIKLDFKYFLDFEIVDLDIDNGFKAMSNEDRKSYVVLYQFISDIRKAKRAIVYVEFITFFEDGSPIITRLNNIRMITKNDFGYISKSFYHHLEHVSHRKDEGIAPIMLNKGEFLTLYLDIFKKQK